MADNLPTILCCVCSAAIKANAANMCVSCIKQQVDVTEGVTKEVTIHQCRGCLKYVVRIEIMLKLMGVDGADRNGLRLNWNRKNSWRFV